MIAGTAYQGNMLSTRHGVIADRLSVSLRGVAFGRIPRRAPFGLPTRGDLVIALPTDFGEIDE
jgi:hypothetical protein